MSDKPLHLLKESDPATMNALFASINNFLVPSPSAYKISHFIQFFGGPFYLLDGMLPDHGSLNEDNTIFTFYSVEFCF